MTKIIQKFSLTVLSVVFMLFCIISIGALGEDYIGVANSLNHILSKTLAITLIYIAIKLPLVALIKSAMINCCFALLSWKEVVKPGYLRELLTFSRQEVLQIHYQSVTNEIQSLIPLLNNNIHLEDKIRFCMNPASVTIAIICSVKEYWIYSIDSLAETVATSISHVTAQSHNSNSTLKLTNLNSVVCRILKGTMVIICELLILPLKFIQPMAGFGYWLMHFLAIVLPDAITDMFLKKNAPNTKKHFSYSLFSPHTTNSNTNKNSKYIREQLQN